jgi:hypothetical protein
VIALLSTSAGLDIAPCSPESLIGCRARGDMVVPSRLGWQERRHPVVRDTAPIGRVGVLMLGTRGPGGPGEVLVRVRGGTETYIAWSEQALAKDATVLIIETRGARAVDVIEWIGAPDTGDDMG